ncbi:MAG: anaerobic ribonucleoside-triphosphate reductase activating protein [Epulopiscium sp. Nuni2H_MBin003]|nr:MAG: anaerobic ribonucleoside-triphosphate reductase activating protein [Epulopiscium sp. Nuni2H_MBin003]
MHYSQIRKFDTANGTGIRTTLFVSGCTKECKDCFNDAYKSFTTGYVWDEVIEKNFLAHINSPIIQGVSILGGEPMDQIMDDTLLNLVKKISKNIWIYSGYTFEEIINNKKRYEIIKHCDVLVDGPYIDKLKDLRLAFVGSSNQRIINIQKSLDCNEIVLLKL